MTAKAKDSTPGTSRPSPLVLVGESREIERLGRKKQTA
jgi:hypothetical protein